MSAHVRLVARPMRARLALMRPAFGPVIRPLTTLVTAALLALAAGCSSGTADCDPACAAGEQCVEGVCSAIPAPPDAGNRPPDSGVPVDPCATADAGGHPCGDGRDASPSDTGTADADADASTTPDDATTPDAAPIDAGPADSGVVTVLRVTVTPTVATLVSTNGATVSQAFGVSAEYSDGTIARAPAATWRVDPAVLGSISGTTFTANGVVGGEGRVIAAVDGVEGSARVVVQLREETILPGTPTTAPALFGNLIDDPAREARVLYPLDRAVMPQNVPPVEIQWERSAPGDVFRVTLSKPNVSALVYNGTAVTGFRNSLPVALDGWRRLAQSEPDAWATLTVDRWIAATGEAIRGVPVQVRFARAALLGSIYYWDIVRGRIVRIDDGTTTRDEFMPSPQFGCIGCHTVSPSGRFLAGRLAGGENVAAVYDLTEDLTTPNPPTLFPVTSTTVRWWFSSWSPDESRLVVSVQEQGGGTGRALRFVDPNSGQYVEPVSGALPVGNVTQPAWSRDGTAIAYVGNSPLWGGESTAGDLFTVPVTGPDAVGAPTRVFTGTTAAGLPAGPSVSYPTWSPDSEWIVFARGSSSRSESGRSALYMMRRDGTDLVRLDNASRGISGDVSFQPRFSPFEQDGYFWLTFLSRADYGNQQAGTRFTSRQQLWVAAIKTNPLPGEDPSEVPYWLAGQDTQSLNIAADWAARACLADGDACAVDAACCSGECDGASSVCTPLSMCRALGEACQASEQCCDGQLCVGGTCGGV